MKRHDWLPDSSPLNGEWDERVVRVALTFVWIAADWAIYRWFRRRNQDNSLRDECRLWLDEFGR